jgi:hypothetical protein
MRRPESGKRKIPAIAHRHHFVIFWMPFEWAAPLLVCRKRSQ